MASTELQRFYFGHVRHRVYFSVLKSALPAPLLFPSLRAGNILFKILVTKKSQQTPLTRGFCDIKRKFM